MSLAGKTIGRYRIIEQLGQGGMAVVYKAFDTRLQRDVALKLIRTENIPPAQLEQLQKRFEREALTQSRFHHPNIVPIHDFGEHDGSPYLVMTYLPGGTLQDLTGKPVPYPQAARLLAPIADALAYAHEKDILHRDIKPSNILLGEKGRPTLTDFGIAKLLGDVEGGTLTGTGMGVGTPQYMAPEQWQGKPEKATDIYALGVVFYELVTGHKPYDADTPVALALMQMTEPLPRPSGFVPDLPEHVEQVLYTALASQPGDRYESMAAFEAVLKDLSREEVQPAETPLSQTVVEELPVMPTQAEPEPVEPVIPTHYPVEDKTVDALELSAAPQPRDKTNVQPATQPKFKLPVWGWGLIGLVVLVGIIFGITQLGGGGTEVAETATQIELPLENELEKVEGNIQTVNPDEKIQVTFWHAYGTGSAEEETLAKILDQAAVDMPQYQINVLQVPFNDIFNKYRTDVAAGGGPDMFIAPNDDLGNDARGGLIADITDLAAGKLGDYTELSVDGMSYDGKLYGIPESLKAVVLWYNTDMLPEAPATTDELQALMEGGTPISISFGCYHHWGFFGSFGGQIFDDNWNVVAGDGVANAMGYLNDLYQISKTNAWPLNDSDGLAPFTEGTTAAITNGNWAMGDYRNALGDKLAVAPIPAGPGGPSNPLLGVDGYYFNPNSANKEAALDVALYLTGTMASQLMMDEAGHVPANTTVTPTDPLIIGLLDAFSTAYVRPQVEALNLYWSNFCGTDQVFEVGTPAADWVAEAVVNANK